MFFSNIKQKLNKALPALMVMCVLGFSTAVVADEGPGVAATSTTVKKAALPGMAQQSLTTTMSLADDVRDLGVDQLTDVFDMQPGGVAYDWVAQIFGNWVTHFDNGSKIGKPDDKTLVTIVAGFSNLLALIMGVVIISYVMLAGVINTAASGEVMGRSWSTLWLPLRSSIAMGLIMPIGTLGGGSISGIQAAIVYLALVGSNAADIVWKAAVTNITDGVPLISSSNTLGRTSAKSIAVLAACGYYQKQKKVDNPNVWAWRVRSGKRIKDQETGAYTTPNSTIKGSIDINFGAYQHVSRYGNRPFGVKSKCGTIKMKGDEGVDGATTSHYWDSTQVAAQRVMADLTVRYIEGLRDEIFSKLDMPVKDGGVGGLEQFTDWESELANQMKTPMEAEDIALANEAIDNMYKIATAYDLLNYQFTHDMQKEVALSVANSDYVKTYFSKTIGQGGWGAAGLWYFQISKIQNLAQAHLNGFGEAININSSIAKDQCNPAWSGRNNPFCKHLDTKMYSVFKVQEYANKIRMSANSELPGKNALLAASYGIDCDSATSCDNPAESPESRASMAYSVASGILGVLSGTGAIFVAGQEGVSSVENGTGTANPFLTVTGIGHAINGVLQAILLAMALGSILGSFAGSSPTGVAKKMGEKLFSKSEDSDSGMMTAIITVIFGALVGLGYTLAYGIPFMPVMIWVMLVVGWLVMLVEAVISAPLAVIMMATPEGEGIAGRKTERAISLIAAVIMRPALSIMGLVASIAIAYVGFGIYNTFFWTSVHFNTSWGIFETIAILTMYVAGALTLTRYTFGIIHQLPNNILEWMNSGNGRSFGEGDASGAAEKSAGSVATHVGGAISSAQSSMKNMKAEKAQKLRDEQGKSNQGSGGKKGK